QMRFDLPPLLIVQPKQVAPHPLLCSESQSSAEANQQPIQLATLLLGFHPSLPKDEVGGGDLVCHRNWAPDLIR
ncbi:MAG TPA: hypothetical protein VK479_14500, partial [Micropepsaceae bacterium]|nr:hypothetical protein [Micropepsaceae bacterium]